MVETGVVNNVFNFSLRKRSVTLVMGGGGGWGGGVKAWRGTQERY